MIKIRLQFSAFYLISRGFAKVIFLCKIGIFFGEQLPYDGVQFIIRKESAEFKDRMRKHILHLYFDKRRVRINILNFTEVVCEFANRPLIHLFIRYRHPNQ